MAYLPPGAPVPAPSQFPVPTMDPRTAVNPYAQSSAEPQGYAPPVSPAAQAALTATGISAGDATQQSEAALAKLAQVNPQLAQELLEKRTDSGSGGLFGFLKDVGGAIISPALSMGGKLLDILGRSSHIVPQWFDPDDKGSWFEDIGQAMSGEDKTNWNEVLQNRGILDNAGWLRAGLGFVGDVLTDPITYATFGAGAGVSTAEKAALSSRTVFESFASRVAAAGKFTSIGEAENLLKASWKIAGGQVDNIALARKFSEGGAEELLGHVGVGMRSEVKAVLADAFDAGSQAYRKVYARTWKNYLNASDSKLYSSLEGQGSRVILEGQPTRALFEGIARGANFTKYGDESWGAAKAAAGALGGLRFRFAVPFTQARYISPMVPMSYKMGFGALGRFGAGFGGAKAVQALGPDAERMFSEYGWKGVQDLAGKGDELAKSIVAKAGAGRAPYLRSGFYAASETAGQLTQHFSPGARMFRKGLGYYFYRNGLKNADSMRARMGNDLFYSVVDGGQGAQVRNDLFRRYDRAYGVKALKKLDKVTPGAGQATLDDARLYLDFFGHKAIPHSPADIGNGRLDDWFWNSRPDRKELAQAKKQYGQTVPMPAEREAALVKQEALLAEMKRVIAKVNKDHDAVVLDDMIGTEAFGKTTVERQGLDVGDSAIDLVHARVLNPADEAYLPKQPDNLSQYFEAELPVGNTLPGTKYGGVTEEWAVAQEDLGVTGVRFDLTGTSSRPTVKTRIRAQRIVDVDMEDLENAVPATRETIESGTAKLPEILAAYDKLMDEAGNDLAKAIDPIFENSILRLNKSMADRADLATTALRAAPDAPDGVRFVRDGKPESMVIFDATKVHHITESAPLMRPQGGYFRRTLAKNIRARIGGEARKGEARLFGDPGAIETSFRRQTRDMTLPEAEDYIRDKMNAAGGVYEGITVGPNEHIFEWDPLVGHHAYIDYLGDSYFAHATGRTSRRMMELGNLVPNEFGAVARSARAKFEMPPSVLRQLAKSDRAVQNTYLKYQQRLLDEENRQATSLVKAHERLSTALAYMDAGLTADDVPSDQLASAMDGVVRTGANLQRVVAEENRRVLGKIAGLEDDARIARKVEDGLNVTEWDDLDQFIEGRSNRALFGDEGARDVDGDQRALPSSDDTWRDETEFLNQARAKGTAEEIEPGVWRYKRTFGFKEDVYVATTEIDGAERVIAYRAVSKGGADDTMRDALAQLEEATAPAAAIMDEKEWWEATKGHVTIPREWLETRTINKTPRGLDAVKAGLLNDLGTDEYRALRERMAAQGWDPDKALSLAYDYKKNTLEITDGTHRLALAKDLGIDDIPVHLIGNADSHNLYKWVKENFPESLEKPAERAALEAPVDPAKLTALEDTYTKAQEKMKGLEEKLDNLSDNATTETEQKLDKQWTAAEQEFKKAEQDFLAAGGKRREDYEPNEYWAVEENTDAIKIDPSDSGVSYSVVGQKGEVLYTYKTVEEADDAIQKMQTTFEEKAARKATREEAASADKLKLEERIYKAQQALDEDMGTGGKTQQLFDDLESAEDEWRRSYPNDDVPDARNFPSIRSATDDATRRRSIQETTDAIDNEAGAGGVVASTAEDMQKQGYGLGLLRAHWKSEKVKTMDDVKRMVGDQSLTDAAVRLNKAGARSVLAEQGIHNPELIRDLMARGELYAGKDDSILTKAMGIRKGGRKVRNIEDVTRELAEQRSLLSELDDLRKGAPAKLEGSGIAEEAVTGMTRAQRRAATRFDTAAVRAETAVRNKLVQENKAAMKRGGVEARIRQRVTLAATEHNKAVAEAGGAWTQVKPAVVFDIPPEGGKELMRQVQIPGLDGVFAHPYVAEEIEHLFRGKPPGHLRSMWREHLLGPWKRWATYRNPGFHVRNFFGAWFNNTIGGVNAADHEFSRLVNMARGNYKEWATKKVSAEHWTRYSFGSIPGLEGMKDKLTYGDVSEMLADMGLGRADTKATALTMAGENVREKAGSAIGQRLLKLDDRLRNVGGLTEDYFRVAAWAGGMRHMSGDLYGARAFTMMRHGDYSDLTDTEDFVRDLVPFYKWMRTNVPFQFRMMAENPGAMLAVTDKAQTFAYTVQGLDRYQEEFKMPEWMKRGFNIPIPKGVPFVGGEFITEDLPYTDLYNGARDYLSSGLPIIRNIVESYGVRQSVFTGAPLGEKMVPLSGLFSNPLLEPLVAALPMAQRGKDGTVFIPDTLDNVLSAVPLYSRFHNWMSSDPNRVENRVSTFTSAMLGFSVRSTDLTAAELGFYYDELVPAMDRIRSMGYTIPTAEDLQAVGAALTAYGAAPNADELFPDGVAAVTNQAA